MPYTTKTAMITRFGSAELIQLTDKTLLGAIDDTVLDLAIADADAEINSYLTAYTLPLVTVPANLERVACDIARYYLYDDQLIDSVKQRYDNAVAWLKLVAAGKVVLPADDSGTVPEQTLDDVDYQVVESVFGSTTLSGY